MGLYYSTKHYKTGFSCTFRQWRAQSHCRFLHGYDLQFKFMFAAVDLDAYNWVVDFGSLKSLKAVLEDTFDHKHVVAEDDPLLPLFREVEKQGGSEIRVLPKVGCEAFAYYVSEVTDGWLRDNGYGDRVIVHMVEARENEANSALYQRTPDDDGSMLDFKGRI